MIKVLPHDAFQPIPIVLLSVFLSGWVVAAESHEASSKGQEPRSSLQAVTTALQKTVSVNFGSCLEGTRLEEVVRILGAHTKGNFSIENLADNDIMVSLNVKDMTVAQILDLAERQNGLSHTIRQGIYVIHRVPTATKTAVATSQMESGKVRFQESIKPDFLKKINQQVTMDFDQADVGDVVTFLSQQTGVNMVILDRDLPDRVPPMNLKAKNMPLPQVLSMLAAQTKVVVMVEQDVVIFTLAGSKSR